MNRKALLLYLRDILDLEIAKNKIESLYNGDYQIFQTTYNQLNTVEYESLPKKEAVSWGWILFLILDSVLFIWLGSSSMFFKILGIWGAVTTVILIIMEISSIKEYREKKEEVILYNNNLRIQHEDNLKKIEQLQLDWQKKYAFYNSEYNKVKNLLTSYYSQNILANQYRNLASVFYIYDYMSSSQESLKDTLIHEHMENGIQRILSKLDAIIDQNAEILFLQRRREANDQTIINQNKKMLNSLQNVEENSFSATQYARLSANYSQANAYFSFARYLNEVSG